MSAFRCDGTAERSGMSVRTRPWTGTGRVAGARNGGRREPGLCPRPPTPWWGPAPRGVGGPSGPAQPDRPRVRRPGEPVKPNAGEWLAGAPCYPSVAELAAPPTWRCGAPDAVPGRRAVRAPGCERCSSSLQAVRRHRPAAACSTPSAATACASSARTVSASRTPIRGAARRDFREPARSGCRRGGRPVRGGRHRVEQELCRPGARVSTSVSTGDKYDVSSNGSRCGRRATTRTRGGAVPGVVRQPA